MDLRITRFECQPEEIAEELGIQPTRIWRKGDPLNDKGVLRNKQNGWGLGSGLDRYASFEEHTQALLNIIEPNLEVFIRVCNQYRAELSCAIYMYCNSEESIPWAGFDKKAMQIFAQIGAEIDFDMYVLPGKPEHG